MNILLIEDDPAVAQFIVGQLQAAGHECAHEERGDTGYRVAATGNFDVLIVDRMLPGKDGLTLISELRESGVTAPALVLSALGQVNDRVRGLHCGADDYLVKPFAMDELLARLEVLCRRQRAADGATPTQLHVGELIMNLLTQAVTREGSAINLQPREYKLLEYMMRHEGQVVTRAMLLEHVWGYHFDPQTNVIDVHISRLRQKIDKGFASPLLNTVRGAGYRLGEEAV